MHFIGSYVLDILRFAETLEIDTKHIMAEVPYALKDLQRTDFFVGYETVERVFDQVHEASGSDYFGIQMGEMLMLHATEYVDQMIDSSADVQTAFENAVAYSRMISDSMNCTLVPGSKDFRVEFELNPDWAIHSHNAVKQNLDVALVCAMKSLQRLTAKKYKPVAVNFFYARPKYWNEYYRVFDCAINFNQKVSSICFDQKALGAIVESENAGLLQELSTRAEEILEKLPIEKGTSYLVKKVILDSKGVFVNDISQVADRLGIGSRTLQRRLQQEGTTFKRIQTDMRKKLAISLLSNNGHTVGEVAYLLDFSEPASFVRAFKQWTGVTPKKYHC